MSIGNRIKNAWNALTGQSFDLNDEQLLEWMGIGGGYSRKKLSEVTYYTCLKMLSETMGKLPLKYYQQTKEGRIRADPTDMTYVLTVRPNAYMTPSTLWSTVEMNCQNYGNGYVWLRRGLETSGKYGGEYKTYDAWPMQSNCVSVIMDNVGIFGDIGKLYYQYNDPKSGKTHLFNSQDVIHIKTWYSFDGIMGVSVRDILAETINGAKESQKFLDNLYKNGLTASMALQYTGDLNDDKVKKLKLKVADKLSGSENAGKVIPIPMGLTLTPLKMNLTDAQFFELKKYTALQIAGAFGIKPNQINNYEKSSYSNSESQQLAFLVDTMSYRIQQYEEEINAKAVLPTQFEKGFFYKFNEKSLLRTDAKSQIETLRGAVQDGIYTPNEAREFLDKPKKKGGDILVMNGNYIPLTKVGAQYEKGGENNGAD